MIEFYNKDCIEGMKSYPDKYFDLAIVDPPYQARDAIGVKDCAESLQKAKRRDYHLFENIAPPESILTSSTGLAKIRLFGELITLVLKAVIFAGIKSKVFSGELSWLTVVR